MLEVKKDLDSMGYDCYSIKTKQGTFHICWGGTLDLYWTFFPAREIVDQYTFDVTKEEYYLYRLLDEIYDSVESCDPFRYTPKLGIDDPFEDKIPTPTKYYLETKDRLLKDNTITWLSDDGYNEDAARVSIKKCEDKYEITFNRGLSEGHKTYWIRFRNSGSRYNPFNAPFVIMYNKLKYYDQDSMQIHIEEYIYKEKIKKKTLNNN